MPHWTEPRGKNRFHIKKQKPRSLYKGNLIIYLIIDAEQFPASRCRMMCISSCHALDLCVCGNFTMYQRYRYSSYEHQRWYTNAFTTFPRWRETLHRARSLHRDFSLIHHQLLSAVEGSDLESDVLRVRLICSFFPFLKQKRKKGTTFCSFKGTHRLIKGENLSVSHCYDLSGPYRHVRTYHYHVMFTMAYKEIFNHS